nr:MAG TPA: hypothetical protein [Caudoviricetes sp.]
MVRPFRCISAFRLSIFVLLSLFVLPHSVKSAMILHPQKVKVNPIFAGFYKIR